MKKLILMLILLAPVLSYPEIKAVATTTVIYDFLRQIGKDRVKADYLVRGDQDPHFLEVMPSYMMKLRNADMLIEIGLGLELWAQQLIDGSRNSNIKIIDLSEGIQKKDVPAGKTDASQGDIHPHGNPHYWLDPYNAVIMCREIFNALASFSPQDKDYFKKNLDDYLSKLNSKLSEWDKKMSANKGKDFVFFHQSWIYFADRYGIKIAGYVEPKPGIAPTPSHNAELIGIIKKNNVKYILMENFYSTTAPDQISGLTGAKVVKVATGVYGIKGADSYVQMMDYIIGQITKAS